MWRQRQRQAVHVLHGTEPGSVWAVDFAEAPGLVEGLYPYLLAVRDLASGLQLLWQPVAEASAARAVEALAYLVAVYGAPLVLKADNGSAFGVAATQAWAAAAGVELLDSPPGLPGYNGAIEAGIGSLKGRTEWRAWRRGCPRQWSWQDADAARWEANAQARPWGEGSPSPAEAWARRRVARRRVLLEVEREAFRARVASLRPPAWRELELSEAGERSAAERRQVDRGAIHRALVAHGYLTFTRRRIPLPADRQRIVELKGSFVRQRMCAVNVGGNRQQPRR